MPYTLIVHPLGVFVNPLSGQCGTIFEENPRRMEMAERTDRLSMRMPPELIDRLRRAARQDHRTLTSAVERAIVLYCELVEAERGEKTAA